LIFRRCSRRPDQAERTATLAHCLPTSAWTLLIAVAAWISIVTSDSRATGNPLPRWDTERPTSQATRRRNPQTRQQPDRTASGMTHGERPSPSAGSERQRERSELPLHLAEGSIAVVAVKVTEPSPHPAIDAGDDFLRFLPSSQAKHILPQGTLRWGRHASVPSLGLREQTVR